MGAHRQASNLVVLALVFQEGFESSSSCSLYTQPPPISCLKWTRGGPEWQTGSISSGTASTARKVPFRFPLDQDQVSWWDSGLPGPEEKLGHPEQANDLAVCPPALTCTSLGLSEHSLEWGSLSPSGGLFRPLLWEGRQDRPWHLVALPCNPYRFPNPRVEAT